MVYQLPPWYPEVVETVLGLSPGDERAFQHLKTEVERLAESFNSGNVADHPRYLTNSKTQQAYFAYYTTANFLKLVHPLNELILSPTLPQRIRILDAGCGTGTGLLGLAAWAALREAEGKAIPAFEYTACDALNENLIFTSSVNHAVTQAWHPFIASYDEVRLDLSQARTLDAKYDLILGMNVLGEIEKEWRQHVRMWMKSQLALKGFVVLIEPALLPVSRGLLAFRDDCIEDGWTVYAPCFRQATCPALNHPRDWCHHDIEWERPAFIEAIDLMIGHRKESLKFSYVTLNLHGETYGDRLSEGDRYQRVVSELLVQKGRTLAYLCGTEGRRLYMKNRRDTTYENAAFDELDRYDVVCIHDAEYRAHDVRVGLEATVTKL